MSPHTPLPRLSRRKAERLFLPHTGTLAADETGGATAEYAIATMAAVGFAGLLVVIMKSDAVRGILNDLIKRALSVS